MTDNMKKFMERISADDELAKRASKLDKAELVALAKAQGLELGEADLAPEGNGEINDDELSTVAGGGKCTCVAGGGGTAGEYYKACACVAMGFGNNSVGKLRCDCYLYGTGEE